MSSTDIKPKSLIGGGGGNPKGDAVGVQGFATGSYELSAANALLPFGAGGWGIALAVHVLAAPATASHMFACGRATATRGSALTTHASGAVRFTCVDGAVVAIHSPTTSLAAVVGQIVVLAGQFDPAGFLRLYRAGAQVGAGTAIVGFTSPNNTDKTAIGTNPFAPSAEMTWGRVVGCSAWSGVPDAAAILAHYNACKAANTMESMGGAGVVNVNRWQAKDNVPNAATWVDDIGGMVLTKTGTLSSVIFNPTWE